MTSVEMLLVEKLLKQHFGPIVSEVGKLCLEAGAAPLRLIHFKSKYNYGHVKKALAVLIQHHFLTYKSTARGSTVYSVCMDNIILLIRYPKYVYIAKLLSVLRNIDLLKFKLNQNFLQVLGHWRTHHRRDLERRVINFNRNHQTSGCSVVSISARSSWQSD